MLLILTVYVSPGTLLPSNLQLILTTEVRTLVNIEGFVQHFLRT